MDESDEIYQVKNETINHGKNYELLVLAFISLRLIDSQKVKDFRIWSNDENCGYGKFDDIIIDVSFSSGLQSIWALQVKHSINKKKKELPHFRLNNRQLFFNPKYFGKLFENVNENVNYIIFTNTDFSRSKQNVTCSTSHNEDPEPEQSTRARNDSGRKKSTTEIMVQVQDLNPDHLLWLINSNEATQGTYRFTTDSPEKAFLDNFFLISSQKNADTLKSYILNSFLGSIFKDVRAFSLYFHFLEQWSLEPKREILSQQRLITKLTQSALFSFIPPLATKIDDKKFKYINTLKNITSQFDVTLMESMSQDLVDILWTLIAEESRRPFCRPGVCNVCFKNVWYQTDMPLIIYLEDKSSCKIFLRIAFLCHSKKIAAQFLVITREDISSLDTKRIFKNLQDLVELDGFTKTILPQLSVSIQCKPKVKLQTILNTEEYRLLNVDDFVELLKEDIIGQYDINDNSYVEREISVNLVSSTLLIDEDIVGNFLIILQKNSKVAVKEDSWPTKNVVLCSDTLEDTCKIQELIADTTQYIWLKVFDCELLEVVDFGAGLELIQRHKHWSHIYRQEDREYSIKSKLNLLCADPGMGKTQFLKNLKKKLPPMYFTLKICLRECSAFFDQDRSIDEIIDQICVKTQIKSPLELKFFQLLKSKKKLIFMWDGLTEVSATNLSKVIKIIQEIRAMGYVQYVTSRNYYKQELENIFQTFSKTLNFTETQQRVLIANLLSNVEITQKKEFDGIFESISPEFVAVPLQLYLLITSYRDNNTAVVPKLSSKADFYQYFVDLKIQFYYKNETNATILYKQNKEYLIEKFEILSLKIKFYDEIYSKLTPICYNEQFLEIVKRGWNLSGIIKEVQGTQEDEKGLIPIFTQDSYADYFAASFLSKNYKAIPDFKTLIFKNKFVHVRYFFDLILAKNHEAHLNVLNKNFNEELLLPSVDEGGRNPLQILCSWYENGFLNPDMKNPDEQQYIKLIENYSQISDPSAKDHVFGMDAFEYAEFSGSKIAERILHTKFSRSCSES